MKKTTKGLLVAVPAGIAFSLAVGAPLGSGWSLAGIWVFAAWVGWVTSSVVNNIASVGEEKNV